MSLNNTPYSVGVNHVGSYQVSGVPFVFDASNATKTATLNYVTSEIQVNVSGTPGNSTIHFGDADSTAYKLPAGLSTFRVKCKKVVVFADSSANISVCVSLTNIKSNLLASHDQDDFGSVA